MKKKILTGIITILFIVCFCFFMFGCSSCDRHWKSCTSDMTDGLPRKVNVYSYTGNLLATYEGKIDLEENESKVLFDLDGKRYVYYNAVVEVIEK